jgi:hypothetical protein
VAASYAYESSPSADPLGLPAWKWDELGGQFFLSALVTGSPAPRKAAAVALMWRNWASRSGCRAPSRVLRCPAGCTRRRSGSARPPHGGPGTRPRSTRRRVSWSTSSSTAAPITGHRGWSVRSTRPGGPTGPDRRPRLVYAHHPERGHDPPAPYSRHPIPAGRDESSAATYPSHRAPRRYRRNPTTSPRRERSGNSPGGCDQVIPPGLARGRQFRPVSQRLEGRRARVVCGVGSWCRS